MLSYLSAGLPPFVLEVSEQVLRNIARSLPATDIDVVRSHDDNDWVHSRCQQLHIANMRALLYI